MNVAWPCKVCGGKQVADDEGVIIESQCDTRFHSLLERIEAIEAALSASTTAVANEEG